MIFIIGKNQFLFSNMWLKLMFLSVFIELFIQFTNSTLVYPRTSPTRVQIITGIGIPVPNLHIESITIGYVFKAEYFLPENASNYLDFLSDPFNPTLRPITGTGSYIWVPDQKRAMKGTNNKRSIHETIPSPINRTMVEQHGFDREENMKFEKYQVEAVEVDGDMNEIPITLPPGEDQIGMRGNEEDEDDEEEEEEEEEEWDFNNFRLKQPQNYDTSRWTIYKGIETIANTKGLEGRPCVLRSICEAAHAPFSYTSGILGELMHIIMTPSMTDDQIIDNSQNEYLHAEQLGREGAPCEKIFKECERSILDEFSGIYQPLKTLINLFGK